MADGYSIFDSGHENMRRTPMKITKAQGTSLIYAFRDAGVAGSDEVLKLVTKVTGRRVKSLMDLYDSESSRIMEALRRQARQRNGGRKPAQR